MGNLQGAYRFFSNPKNYTCKSTSNNPITIKVLEKARFSEKLVLFIQDGSELFVSSHSMDNMDFGPTADSNGNDFMFHYACC